MLQTFKYTHRLRLSDYLPLKSQSSNLKFQKSFSKARQRKERMGMRKQEIISKLCQRAQLVSQKQEYQEFLKKMQTESNEVYMFGLKGFTKLKEVFPTVLNIYIQGIERQIRMREIEKQLKTLNFQIWHLKARVSEKRYIEKLIKLIKKQSSKQKFIEVIEQTEQLVPNLSDNQIKQIVSSVAQILKCQEWIAADLIKDIRGGVQVSKSLKVNYNIQQLNNYTQQLQSTLEILSYEGLQTQIEQAVSMYEEQNFEKFYSLQNKYGTLISNKVRAQKLSKISQIIRHNWKQGISNVFLSLCRKKQIEGLINKNCDQVKQLQSQIEQMKEMNKKSDLGQFLDRKLQQKALTSRTAVNNIQNQTTTKKESKTHSITHKDSFIQHVRILLQGIDVWKKFNNNSLKVKNYDPFKDTSPPNTYGIKHLHLSPCLSFLYFTTQKYQIQQELKVSSLIRITVPKTTNQMMRLRKNLFCTIKDKQNTLRKNSLVQLQKVEKVQYYAMVLVSKEKSIEILIKEQQSFNVWVEVLTSLIKNHKKLNNLIVHFKQQ